MSVSRNSYRFLLLGALAATLGAGAAQAQTGTPIPVKAGTNPLIPADSIVTNTTLSKNTLWILKGFVVVKSGVTLTIEPGTTIQSDATVKGTLIVDRGGKLMAAGTPDEPITFKGPNDDRGTWGGIVLLGKSYSNQALGGSVQYEALTWANYAGTSDDDNSGVLTYVRLINPGYSVLVDRELNGLTLCAVGSGTTIHHIQVHRGDDDGIEWFGGTVNTSHLVVTNATDDSYDTDHGYSGNSQYMIAIQNAEPPRPRANPIFPNGETVGDRGLECGSSLGVQGRHTNPVWKNITFIENGRSGGAFEAKEECGGTYEKMVLVAGGITPQDTSDWALFFLSPRTVNGIFAQVPHIDFKNTFITGKYRKKYEITGDTSQIRKATNVLNAKIKAFPFSEINSFGLHKDLSASHPQIAADEAGAIVGNDLWYQGWTLPGTVEFPMGDNKNVEPVIAFSSTPGYVEAPANFTLNATVTDADGVALVEILKGETVLDSSTTGSVSFAVTGAAVGSHTYKVRTRDNYVFPRTTTRTLEVVVSEPNTAPSINVTRTGNATLVEPASFILTAASTDPDGTALIEVLLDDDVVGTNSGSQVAVPAIELTAGTYTYKVRARDNHAHNALTADFEFVVTVNEAPNTLPVVNLTRPEGILFAPAAFTLTASALDLDGIASLKVFEGDVELGSAASGTLDVPVADKPAGTYTYRVEGTDSHNKPLTASKTLTVTVVEVPTAENNDDPVVTLDLVETDPLVAPATFNLLATAVDANNIDTLQILLDGEVVATGTSLTLTYKPTGKAAGAYAFTARAKDKHAENPREGTKALTVTVNAPPANGSAPTLSFTRSGADTLNPGAPFTLNVLAEDPNGIDSVQILLGKDVVAKGVVGSLSYLVSGLPAGTHVFTARAVDKHAADPMAKTQEMTVVVRTPSHTFIASPLRDLAGLSSFAARGQDLLLKSAGFGRVHLTVMSLSGRRVASRSVNLMQGQNVIPVGSLRGVHVVLVSDGIKSRSARVVFSAGR